MAISYSAKIKYIRQFDTVSSGRLTRAKKASITRRYNHLKRLDRLSFIAADRATIKKMRAVGVYTTAKGFFIGVHGDEKIRVLKNGLLFSHIKSRVSYVVIMTQAQIVRFMRDPELYVDDVIKKEYADLFKKYPPKTHRFFIRLVFKWGVGTLDFTIERLRYYMVHMTDVIDSRTGISRLDAGEKKKQIAAAMIGIKLMFYKRPGNNKKNVRKKTKNKRRRLRN